MWSVPLRVSCPGPVLRLACLGGGAVRSRFPPTWLGDVGAAAGRPRGGAFDCCVVGAGVRLWGPRSVPVGGGRGVDLVSRRRSARFP